MIFFKISELKLILIFHLVHKVKNVIVATVLLK